jgi:Mg-chelatase subunit ChlD
MASSAQSYFKQFYKTASSYAPSVQTQNAMKAFIWDNKDLFVVGTVVGLVIWKIVHYIRNMPQMPDLDMKCSLNNAVLTIKIPTANYTPPNVTLTLCVDMSGSMLVEDRAGEVKRAVVVLLVDAQEAVTRSAEAKISLAITGFRTESTIVTPATQLTATNGKSENIKKQVEALRFEGGTQLLVGFEGAVIEAEKLSKANPLASHFVVYLTDGNLEKHEVWDDKKLFSLQKRLTSISAKVFAVGIGKEHSEKILKQIATGNGFKGTYIDTSVDKNSIKHTIAAIYNQAIPTFQQLDLSSSLPAGTWSVDHAISIAIKEQSKVSLGSLVEGGTLTKHIVIHGDKLKADLDLSTVFFNLTFKDPKGREGSRKLYWRYSPVVVTAIEQACRTYRK